MSKRRLGPQEYPNVNELRWQDHAKCNGIDPDIFYPEKGETYDTARRVCSTCIVRRACLKYALENREPYGVWGGLSEPERKLILRRGNLRLAEDAPREIGSLAG